MEIQGEMEKNSYFAITAIIGDENELMYLTAGR